MKGSASQTYMAPEPPAISKFGIRDVVSWLIGLLGVAVAALGVYLNYIGK